MRNPIWSPPMSVTCNMDEINVVVTVTITVLVIKLTNLYNFILWMDIASDLSVVFAPHYSVMTSTLSKIS